MKEGEKTYLEAWLEVAGEEPERLGHYRWLGGRRGGAVSARSPRFTKEGAVVRRVSPERIILKNYSRHPVFLNSKAVELFASLSSGDMIRIGSTEVRIRTERKPAHRLDELFIIDWDGFLDSFERAKRNRPRIASFAVIRPDGSILKSSPDARRILTMMFDWNEGDAVPSELFDWIRKGESGHLIKVRNHLYFKIERTSMADGGTVILLEDLRLWDGTEWINNGNQGRPFTAAERDFLHWSLHGKSVPEIATILNSSERQVQKLSASAMEWFRSDNYADLLRCALAKDPTRCPWWVYRDPA
ncbi:MAG: hypothetical protein ACPGVU_10680 [Limisphaerales bacterium]